MLGYHQQGEKHGSAAMGVDGGTVATAAVCFSLLYGITYQIIFQFFCNFFYHLGGGGTCPLCPLNTPLHPCNHQRVPKIYKYILLLKVS